MTDKFYSNIAYKIFDMGVETFLLIAMILICIVFMLKLIYRNLPFEYLKTMFVLVVFALTTHIYFLNFLENQRNIAENKIILAKSSNLTMEEKNKIIINAEKNILLTRTQSIAFLDSLIFVVISIILFGTLLIAIRETSAIRSTEKMFNKT